MLENCHQNFCKLDFMILETDEIPRTYTSAIAMLQGKSLINKDWITASLREDRVLDYSKFQVNYDTNFRTSNFVLINF